MYAAVAGENRAPQVVRLASAWTEGGVASIVSGSDQGYREWRVAAQVDEGAPHSFLSRDALSGTSGEQRLHSRESRTNPPQLVVTAIDRAAGVK